MAPELIAVIRFLRMEELREVSLEEIKLAAGAWAAEERSNPRARSYTKSASYFIRCEEVAALSRKVEDTVSATRTLCE
jgi:hypothetical protein